jgi:hypothetical protein
VASAYYYLSQWSLRVVHRNWLFYNTIISYLSSWSCEDRSWASLLLLAMIEQLLLPQNKKKRKCVGHASSE